MSADDRSRNLVRRTMIQSAVRSSTHKAGQATTEQDSKDIDYGEETIRSSAEQAAGTTEKPPLARPRSAISNFALCNVDCAEFYCAAGLHLTGKAAGTVQRTD